MNPPSPDGYMWRLWLLYAVFIIVVALLYLPSRWYWRRKTADPARWMKYIRGKRSTYDYRPEAVSFPAGGRGRKTPSTSRSSPKPLAGPPKAPGR
jgi:hypothetical protein